MNTTAEVLIVGAGPVGLLLATELSRDGVDVLLIDRMTRRSFFSKALGVTPRTLEIFDDLGIVQDAIDAGVWMRGITSFTDGAPGPKIDIPAGLPFGILSLAQFDTEGLLEACLHTHGGRVQYGWTLTGFTQDSDHIHAQLAGPDGATHTVECQFLVGCDGAHSKVRETLGLDFTGGQYPQTFALADLEVDWNLPRGHFYRFNHTASQDRAGTTLVAVPVHGSARRYRLSTMLPNLAEGQPAEGSEARTPPTLDQVKALMTSLLPEGTILSSLHWSSVYRINHRIVPRYQQGRVFLAGDAAHVHPPVGGQGMNTGLQDAHNLAWKLTLTCRHLASPALLGSYSTERHAVGLDVVENTSKALNDVLAQRTQLPGMRETQLLISYRDSPIVRDDRTSAATAVIAAGDRVPDVAQLRRAYMALPFRLHERLGRGRHVLIGFIGNDNLMLDTLEQMLRLLRETFGAAATGFVIMAKDQTCVDREDIAVMHDSTGEFAAAFDAMPGSAWLIRPDGHIAWCTDEPSLDGLRSALAVIH